MFLKEIRNHLINYVCGSNFNWLTNQLNDQALFEALFLINKYTLKDFSRLSISTTFHLLNQSFLKIVSFSSKPRIVNQK